VRLLFLGLLATAPAARASATILVAVGDGPDAGMNDSAPADSVGGNNARTVGAQRLAVFQEAARIWGLALDSAVPIHVLANFQALTCDSQSGVLGRAYSPNIFASDDPTFDAGVPPTVFPRLHTWYVAAESERFAGKAVLSASGTAPENYQIVATFNSALDTPSCLGGIGWYYGFDTNHGEKFDLLTVVLHEFGHGLGFTSFDDPTTGQHTNGEPDIWDYFLYDENSGKHWIDLNDAQRLASVTSNALAWDGPAVKAAVPGRLDAALVLRVNTSTPKNITALAGAQFGGTVGTTPLNGPIGVASNGYGCNNSGPLASLSGTIAVVDRGPPDAGCTFVEKARNAQDAGAVAVLFANYTTGLVSPGGVAPDVTIPAFGITQVDGASLKAAVGTAASLLRDPSQGFAGADSSARGLMFAPNPFNPGSSVVHWDTSATPNLLMEYAINPDLQNDLDLTPALLFDIGWNLVDVSVKGSGPTTLASGAQGTYTFVITNPGPSKAPAVTATNAVSGMTFVSNSGDCTGAFPCNLGDLDPGATRTITSVFQAGAGNNLTTSVTVASSANYNATNDTALLTINPTASPDAGTGGNGGSSAIIGCGAAPAGPMAGLTALMALGWLVARRRGAV
jgi:uncharacterized repeat protein (TIGR01451 family)/uncharacterized protein (TIGR03382 family)